MSTCVRPCQKTFIQQVNKSTCPELAAYWTLDEASGDRIDEVDGVPMTDLGGDPAPGSGVVGVDAVPGMFSNALHFYNMGALGYRQWLIGHPLGSLPSMVTAGKGLSMFGWLKIVSYGLNFLNYNALGFSVGAGYLNLGLTSAVQGVTFSNGSTTSFSVVLPVGSWFFFHMFLDSTLNKCGFSVNNGAPTYGPFGVGTFPAGSYVDQVFVSGISNIGTCNEIIVDEIGLTLDDKLCDSQAAYLYNSGAGRTWPITLP